MLNRNGAWRLVQTNTQYLLLFAPRTHQYTLPAMSLLWLRRGRSTQLASCLPAVFSANQQLHQLSQWLDQQWCHQQHRQSSAATVGTVDRSIPVHDRYPEDTKPPALCRLVPNLLDYPELQKVHGSWLHDVEAQFCIPCPQCGSCKASCAIQAHLAKNQPSCCVRCVG